MIYPLRLIDNDLGQQSYIQTIALILWVAEGIPVPAPVHPKLPALSYSHRRYPGELSQSGIYTYGVAQQAQSIIYSGGWRIAFSEERAAHSSAELWQRALSFPDERSAVARKFIPYYWDKNRWLYRPSWRCGWKAIGATSERD